MINAKIAANINNNHFFVWKRANNEANVKRVDRANTKTSTSFEKVVTLLDVIQ